MQRGILAALENEKKDTIAENAMKIIERNIALAKEKSQPLCQDTGSVLFYVGCPVGFDQVTFEETARSAVTEATKRGISSAKLSGFPDRQKRRHQRGAPARRPFTFINTAANMSRCASCSREAAAKMSARNIFAKYTTESQSGSRRVPARNP